MTWRMASALGWGRGFPNLALVTALSALVTQACGQSESSATSAGPSAMAGSSSQSGSSGAPSGGASGSGGSSSVLIDVTPTAGTAGSGCEAPVLFADQIVNEVGPHRIFYSWTTDEQVAELRAGTALFSRSERPGQGRGLLFTELAAYAAAGDSPAQQLATLLGEQLFSKARFAWPNPWATLLGFPGESYGNQLLRIELEPEAWTARFDADRALTVFDASGKSVPIEDALASPERIGAIYHEAQGDSDSSLCGTFARGGVGFREFALGNLKMVARWSLATSEITRRLEDDLAVLERFAAELECLSVQDPAAWADQVQCEWDRRSITVSTSSTLSNYDGSLGLPSELYWPSPDNLTALIAALESSLPSGEPLEVTPSD